jgi:hypothetical protein
MIKQGNKQNNLIILGKNLEVTKIIHTFVM